MTEHTDRAIRRIIDGPAFHTARATPEARHVEDTIRLTEIEAPPFQEATRAGAFLEMARAQPRLATGRRAEDQRTRQAGWSVSSARRRWTGWRRGGARTRRKSRSISPSVFA